VAALNLIVLRQRRYAQREENPKTGETKDAYVSVEKHLLNTVYRYHTTDKASFSEGEMHPGHFVGVVTANRLTLSRSPDNSYLGLEVNQGFTITVNTVILTVHRDFTPLP